MRGVEIAFGVSCRLRPELYPVVLPEPQKYVEEQPSGLFLGVLGHYLTNFGGPGTAHLENSGKCVLPSHGIEILLAGWFLDRRLVLASIA